MKRDAFIPQPPADAASGNAVWEARIIHTRCRYAPRILAPKRSTLSRMHRPRFVLASLLVIGLMTGCRSTPSTPAARAVSADTWATVDGREITRADVDKAYQRTGNASQ